MSFGYYDNDWIDPPDPDYEGENREILVEFENDVFKWVDGSMEFENPDDKFDDFYDYDGYSFVADGETIEEYVYDALTPYFPNDEEEGYYRISGWVSIPYIVCIPTRLSKNEEDPEIEIDGKPTAGEIKIEPIELN